MRRFFPMLPTVRRYAFTTLYAPMNLRDAFVELMLRPSTRWRVRSDVRQLWLAEGADRWYAGSGATMNSGTYFGYAGRQSGGHTRVGTVIEGALDLTLGQHWSVNGFAGGMRASRVVTASFRDSWARFAYLENVIQF